MKEMGTVPIITCVFLWSVLMTFAVVHFGPFQFNMLKELMLVIGVPIVISIAFVILLFISASVMAMRQK